MAVAARHLDDFPDDGVELDRYAGLMAVTVTRTPPATILERLATARPAWQQDAACRGHGEISWFSAADVKAARAVCAGCPVQVACRDYGRSQAAGVWGGKAKGMRPGRSTPAAGLRTAR